MNFYLNAITVTEKDGEVKVLQEPKIIFAGSQKEVEYISLKAIPKKYAKKLGNVNIYVQQLFNVYTGNYSGYGTTATYSPSIFTSLTGRGAFNSSSTSGSVAINNGTNGSVITADSINGDES